MAFDGGLEALVACRGSQSPRQKGWKMINANDDVELQDFALAA